MSSFNYVLNNPILLIDPDGRDTSFANNNMKAYVNKYALKTRVNRRGKVKKNGDYNPAFAALVQILVDSDEMFEFTDDASKITGNKSTNLGEFNISKDGSQFNIVVPNFSSGEKGRLTSLMGGRNAILVEEAFHATQLVGGDMQKTKLLNGNFGLKLNGINSTYLEVNAKIFMSNSSMVNSRSSTYFDGYTTTTMAGLIKNMKGNRQEIARLLLTGTTKRLSSTFGNMPDKVVKYPPAYSIY
jgi:hypothetical protein